MNKNTEKLREQAASFIDFMARIERLSDLPRTGWLFSGIQEPESVAAHQYGVAIIALWLGECIDKQVELEDVYRIAILHDMSEALLTDLPKPVKHFIGSEAVEKAENKAETQLLDNMPGIWSERLNEYRRQQTLEARLVKAADKIQMLTRSLKYRQQNRGNIDRFWTGDWGGELYEDIPLVDAIFSELERAYREEREIGTSF